MPIFVTSVGKFPKLNTYMYTSCLQLLLPKLQLQRQNLVKTLHKNKQVVVRMCKCSTKRLGNLSESLDYCPITLRESCLENVGLHIALESVVPSESYTVEV